MPEHNGCRDTGVNKAVREKITWIGIRTAGVSQHSWVYIEATVIFARFEI